MKRIAFVRQQSCRVCSSKAITVSTMVGRIYSHHPRSGFPLKAKESPKRPHRLSRRHSWNSIAGRITSTDNNLPRLSHAFLPT